MGGFFKQRSLPEVDALDFASRVARLRALLLNGRYDFYFPEDTYGEFPMFRLFGVPDEQRSAGSSMRPGTPSPAPDLIRESLGWLRPIPSRPVR